MRTSVLYLNKPEVNLSDVLNDLKFETIKINYSDKETLIKIIEALIETNSTLKKYAESLESKLYY